MRWAQVPGERDVGDQRQWPDALQGLHRAWKVPDWLAAENYCFSSRRRRRPHIVRGYLGGPHVRYVLDENPTSS
ncbi:hypothetical protein F5983_25410 [Streptomyces arboris]|uniref:Uncharacterized protein n=1 Tax=Streptomyces arboris TaxID=2600619 RepID=A0A5N5EFN8_9ACTN|nr:hypothetical protein F5983_25410 [Streptomyces arboris]